MSHDSVLVGTEKQKGLLSRCLKTASDGADATWRGRSFQTVAPETGNAHLPIVERRTGGTSRQCEVEDRSVDVMSAFYLLRLFLRAAVYVGQRSVLPEISCLHYLLPDKRDPSVTERLRHPRNFETLKSRTAKFQNSLIPYSLTHFL